jgi:beta-phosphoglucomutase
LKLKGVLFDLDGVVLKSMEQHLEAWQYAFNKYGISVTANEFYQLEGRGVRAVVKELTHRYKINADLASELMETKINYYDKIFKVEFYEGLIPLLATLKSHDIKMAIITGGFRDRVSSFLQNHLDGYFSALVTSDDVIDTKPFPEPYLKGAELLNLKSDECIVVENAPLGVRAGKNADMKVIAIQTTLTEEYLVEADYIVSTFDEVKQILLEMLNGSPQ